MGEKYKGKIESILFTKFVFAESIFLCNLYKDMLDVVQ